mgnify:FL=1
MKTKILLWLSLIVKAVSVITGLSALPQLALLPPEWMAYAGFAFAAASVIKDVCNRIGDLLDDGKLNQSFKALALFLLPLFCLTSCAGGDFLGVSKAGWADIGRDVAKGALQGATASALPAYASARAKTSAKAVYDPQP